MSEISKTKKIEIISRDSGTVGITVPDLHLRRIWERKGAKKVIEFGALEQAIYDPGVEYLFRQGILDIEDINIKIALGLEPEGVLEPVNTITLNDGKMAKMLKADSLEQFKETLGKLTKEQQFMLVEYAINNEIVNMDKCALLKKATNTDIVKAIELKRQAAE